MRRRKMLILNGCGVFISRQNALKIKIMEDTVKT
jgi:hypothetical protein